MSRRLRAVTRLCDGSATLVRRLWDRAAEWVARGRREDLDGWRAALGCVLRALLLALGVYLLARIVRAVPSLMWALSAAWTIAAWRAGKTPPQPHEEPTKQAPASSPEDVRAATLEWIWQQVADRNGVHLSDLLAHAHAHGMHTTLDVPAFRAALERWGFPVRQQLKVGGRNRPGIHRDDLPDTGAPGPSPADDGRSTTAA